MSEKSSIVTSTSTTTSSKIASTKATCWEQCNRKKNFGDDILKSPLSRCLNLLDLVLLGSGIIIGPAIYVLTGTVAKERAGPATCLSYLVAGLVAMLSSMCYAEFAALVPKAGSAYTYTYVTVGEIWAFCIGWNVVLEYIVGTAAAARAFGGSVDAFTGHAISHWFIGKFGPMECPGCGDYPDVVALGCIILVMFFVCSGAKISASLNNILTTANIIILVFLIGIMFTYADLDNWTKHGGFFSFGAEGVISGAATCFYGYIGFDGIAIAGEEAKNPTKTLPLALLTTLSFVTVVNVLASASLTLAEPYFDVNMAAPYTDFFFDRHVYWAATIITVGVILGTVTTVIGDLYAMPRTVYAMASDGLLFQCLAWVNVTTQTPIFAIIFFGLLSGVLALLLSISTLVEFLAIGTLLGFTFVSASILLIRFRPFDECQRIIQLRCEGGEALLTRRDLQKTEELSEATKELLSQDVSHLEKIGKLKPLFKCCFLNRYEAGVVPARITVIMSGFIIAFCLTTVFGYDNDTGEYYLWAYVTGGTCLAIVVILMLMLCMYEQNTYLESFQMPLVPILPTLSIMCNVVLMLELTWITWLRLAIWLIIGFIIYFCYGIKHSGENHEVSETTPLTFSEKRIDYTSTTTTNTTSDTAKLTENLETGEEAE